MRPHARILALSALLVLAMVTPAAGQTIRGVLVDEARAAPIQGAFVVLLAEDGTELRSVLTDATGRFVLEVPAPGRYTLRADRIGYRSEESPPLDLAAGQALDYRMRVPVQAIRLTGITVSRGGRCVVRPEEGLQVAQVWAEARKALAAAAWTEDRKLVHYEMRKYRRKLAPTDGRVLEERSTSTSGFGANPFSSAPAERLVSDGFMQNAGDSLAFFAPDAEVLLSDAFLDTHCLRLAASREDGLLGIEFEPVSGRDIAEIEGAFWLEPETARLRYLEYRYVNLDLGIPLDRVGGRVRFEMLPNGAWIVRRWRIRMPRVALRVGYWRGERRHERFLAAIDEKGGEVVRVIGANSETIRAEPTATLAGIVYDSTRAAPLPGAMVYLSGTSYSTATDDAGRFRLERLPEGRYSVAFSHARLDSLPRIPFSIHEVELREGRTTTVPLAVPSLARLLAAACPDREGDGAAGDPRAGAVGVEASGLVIGVVYDAATGGPVTNATVVVEWSRWTVALERGAVAEFPWRSETSTDASGRFQICRLPLGVPLTAHAERYGRESEAVEFMLRNRWARRDLSLGTTASDRTR